MKKFFLKTIKISAGLLNRVKSISFFKKNIFFFLIFFLILLSFGWFYFDMIFSLPLFGDATMHGKTTKDILQKGVLNVSSPLPLTYCIFQGILFSIFGEKGMNSIVFLGVLLIAFSVFLMTRELINKNSIALFVTIITLTSPKIIFYSARMYMEILISGFFIFTVFFLIKFIKKKEDKTLFFLAFFTSITASLKQQGLFILFPSILFFLSLLLVINFIKKFKKTNDFDSKLLLKQIILFFFVFILLTFPSYFVLFHNRGKILKEEESFRVIKVINRIGQKIASYEEPKEEFEFNKKWEFRIKSIARQYYFQAVTRAEKRHIWPWEPFTSWKKFVKANGLYLEKFWGGSTKKELANFINYLMVFGFILFVLNIIFRDKILKLENKNLQFYFLVFLLIFLTINYFLFLKNTDQMRYHLFVPILLSIFSGIGGFFFYQSILGKIRIKYLKLFFLFLIVILFMYSLIALLYKDTKWNKRWYRAQLYGPSKGGIASVREAGKWLKEHTKDYESVWQNCGNELAYYSERNVHGAPWYYFLEEFELRKIFKDRGDKYIVIFDSQVVPDEKWTNYCWVPESFVKKIQKIYPLVFQTSFGDIKVYKVQ